MTLGGFLAYNPPGSTYSLCFHPTLSCNHVCNLASTGISPPNSFTFHQIRCENRHPPRRRRCLFSLSYLPIINQLRCPDTRLFSPQRLPRRVVSPVSLMRCSGYGFILCSVGSRIRRSPARRRHPQSSGPTPSRRSHFYPNCAYSTLDDDPNMSSVVCGLWPENDAR